MHFNTTGETTTTGPEKNIIDTKIFQAIWSKFSSGLLY